VVANVPIQAGANALAILVRNRCWASGFCASLDLNEIGVDDTVRSEEATWACKDRSAGMLGSEVSTAGYDESTWMPPGDYGLLVKEDNTDPKHWFTRYGIDVQYLYYDRVHWLWHPKTVYMRKSFTTSESSADLLFRGNGYAYKVYVNGVLVKDSLRAHGDVYNKGVIVRDVALNADAENVIAVEGTTIDSLNFSFMKAGLVAGGSVIEGSGTDSTWRHSWSKPAGWNDVGFDDSDWLIPLNHRCVYEGVTDPLTRTCDYIWPGSFWFRTEFSTDAVGQLRIVARTRPAAAPLRPEYFNLLGRRAQPNTLRPLGNNAMVIERTKLFENEAVRKVLRLGR
jgi:hypothetical protein